MGTLYDELFGIASTKALNKKVSNYNKWEQKMMAKGWSFVKLEKEIVATWVFVSPERRKEIEKENEEFRNRFKKNKKKK